MKWNKYTIKTVTDAEDIIIATLYDIGVQGAEIQDKVPLTALETQVMFAPVIPDMPEDDGIAYLNFYLDPEEDQEEILENVRQELASLAQFMDIGEGTITASETEDKDWINNWKKYFKQFYVDDILIIPSWEEVKEEDKDRMIIHIDPGTAFGTGMHETTQLAIHGLKKYMKPGMEVLDVGTGSGILSIASVMLGAGHCLGTDLDPCTIPAVADNKAANNIPEDAFELVIGNLIDSKETQDRAGYEKYDIVVANILADVLEAMTPVVIHQMKPGAIYITSGIIDEKEAEVREAILKAGLEILETNYQNEWVSIVARKA